MSEKLTLFTPVYNGGIWFKECLDSIFRHRTCFQRVIVSINKGDCQQEDIATAQAFASSVPEIDVTIIVQEKRYSALNHGKVLWWQMRKLKLDGYIMIMAHDDILLPTFSEIMRGIFGKLRQDVIINPARTYFRKEFSKENEWFTYYGTRAFEEGIPVDDFISLDIDRHYITNMSGIICHHTVFRLAHSSNYWLSYGYRGEYIFLTTKGLNRILGTDEPIIGIRKHENNQGGVEKPLSRRKDELVYLTHCLLRTEDAMLKNKILPSITFHVHGSQQGNSAKAVQRRLNETEHLMYCLLHPEDATLKKDILSLIDSEQL